MMRTYTRRHTLKECLEPIEGVLGLCRLCLGDAKESIPIFANKSDICTALAMRIMMCVGYEVTREDCLPNTICIECHKELNNFYEFRKKCATTYQKLKSHVLAVEAKRVNDVLAKQQEEKEKSNLPEEAEPNPNLKDRLVLALTNIDIVNIESSTLQNGLDNIVNTDLNGLLNGPDYKGVESCNQEPCQPKDTIEVCPDVKEFLSLILVEMGILRKQNDDVVVTERCRNIEIDTGDNNKITMEIFEIEDQNEIGSKHTENVKTKVKNNVTNGQTNDKPQCSQCGKRFATWGVVRRHLRTHSGERPHRCPHCPRAFAQRAVLRRHELVHQAVRPFACSWCPKSFTQRGALASHTRVHMTPDARPLAIHRCPHCPKVFLHASGLSRHAVCHSGRVFRCTMCQRVFSDNSSLRRHQRTKHQPRQEI